MIRPPEDGGFSDTLVADKRAYNESIGQDFMEFAGPHRFEGDPFDGWAGDVYGYGLASLDFQGSPGLTVAKGRKVVDVALAAVGPGLTLLDNAKSFGCQVFNSTDAIVFQGNHQQVRDLRTNGCESAFRWANGTLYGNQVIDTAIMTNCSKACWVIESHAMADACTIRNVHFNQSPVGIWLDAWDRRGNRGALSNTTIDGAFFERIGNAYIYDGGDWSGDWARQSTGREINGVTWINMYGGFLDPTYRNPSLKFDYTVRVPHADEWTILGGKQGFSYPGSSGVFRMLHQPGNWNWFRQAATESALRAAGRSLFWIGA